jgi:ubiquinone/menaquinone biosynthesis C-methylase UbiE
MRSPRPRAAQEEYDRLAGEYDRRWRRYVNATLDVAFEALSFREGERVLDIPCGTGEFERRALAASPSLQIVGADLSEAMLRQAQGKRIGAVLWTQADACELPFADASFDRVVCLNSLHYFRDPLAALRDFMRVLRPGGELLLVDWCDDYLSCKLCSLWLRWTDPAFFKIYSLKECRAFVERAGFVIVRAERRRVLRIWGLMRLACRKDG